jgi:site-specific recombinase XerD
MNDQLALVTTPVPDDVVSAQKALRAKAMRSNTSSAYKRAWGEFTTFCRHHNRPSLPANPLIVAQYLTDLHKRQRSRNTIGVYKAAIRHFHHDAGYVDPCKAEAVLETWKGIVRESEEARAQNDAPIVSVHAMQSAVDDVVRFIDDDLKRKGIDASEYDRLAAARDRAIILLTSSTGYLTTQEARSIIVDNYTEEEGGIRVLVKRSPDPGTRPRHAFIRRGRSGLCPIEAMARWIRLGELQPGTHLFRAISRLGIIAPGTTPLSTRHLNEIVKERATKAGLDPNLVSLITMRSWRNGAMQQAAFDGRTTDEILEAAGLTDESRPVLDTMLDESRKARRAGKQLESLLPQTTPLAVGPPQRTQQRQPARTR